MKRKKRNKEKRTWIGFVAYISHSDPTIIALYWESTCSTPYLLYQIYSFILWRSARGFWFNFYFNNFGLFCSFKYCNTYMWLRFFSVFKKKYCISIHTNHFEWFLIIWYSRSLKYMMLINCKLYVPDEFILQRSNWEKALKVYRTCIPFSRRR